MENNQKSNEMKYQSDKIPKKSIKYICKDYSSININSNQNIVIQIRGKDNHQSNNYEIKTVENNFAEKGNLGKIENKTLSRHNTTLSPSSIKFFPIKLTNKNFQKQKFVSGRISTNAKKPRVPSKLYMENISLNDSCANKIFFINCSKNKNDKSFQGVPFKTHTNDELKFENEKNNKNHMSSQNIHQNKTSRIIQLNFIEYQKGKIPNIKRRKYPSRENNKIQFISSNNLIKEKYSNSTLSSNDFGKISNNSKSFYIRYTTGSNNIGYFDNPKSILQSKIEMIENYYSKTPKEINNKNKFKGKKAEIIRDKVWNNQHYTSNYININILLKIVNKIINKRKNICFKLIKNSSSSNSKNNYMHTKQNNNLSNLIIESKNMKTDENLVENIKELSNKKEKLHQINSKFMIDNKNLNRKILFLKEKNEKLTQQINFNNNELLAVKNKYKDIYFKFITSKKIYSKEINHYKNIIDIYEKIKKDNHNKTKRSNLLLNIIQKYEKNQYKLLAKYFYKYHYIIKMINPIIDSHDFGSEIDTINEQKRERKIRLLIFKIIDKNKNIIKNKIKYWYLISKIIKIKNNITKLNNVNNTNKVKFSKKNNIIEGLNKLNHIFKLSNSTKNKKESPNKLISKNTTNIETPRIGKNNITNSIQRTEENSKEQEKIYDPMDNLSFKNMCVCQINNII